MIDSDYKMAVCSLNTNIPEEIQFYTIKDIVNVFLDKVVSSGFVKFIDSNS
jgi:hypothetical protein